MEQGRAICNKIGSATNWHKKQEIHRKKLCVQHHFPIEYNIGSSYCHNSTILDVCMWNHLQQNKDSNETQRHA